MSNKGCDNMIIFPAIDIKDNKCVRLTQGDFSKEKVYSQEPLSVAEKWVEEGAEFLHLVDLDGARDEGFNNKKSIEKILKNINIPMQLGGGIRSENKVKYLLESGVSRVILGTVAVENLQLLKKLLSTYGSERIVVSIDAKNGKVATRGWKVISEVDSISLCKELESIGVKTVVYTDISKDGMLEGPNFSIYKRLIEETNLEIIVSGGVSSMEDIKRLKKLNPYGVIIGKAFYDKLLNFREVKICIE